MRSALHRTLRCVTQQATDRILAKTFATAVEESRNLVLFSAAVVASCFARVLTFARGVTQHNVSFTCCAVFGKIAGKVA